jgi:AcrR family transcriptional regulator
MRLGSSWTFLVAGSAGDCIVVHRTARSAGGLIWPLDAGAACHLQCPLPVILFLMSASAKEPRWERRKQDRPQELLAAALELFVERGYAATRLEDVATRAGVSKGTLYLYFDGKESLFKSVVRANVLPLLDQAEARIEGHAGSSAELLRDLILHWWQSASHSGVVGIAKLMVAESGNFPELARFYHDEVTARGDATIVRVLERGMARGEFRRINADAMKKVIVAPLIMLMLWEQSLAPCAATPIDPLAYLESMIDLCLNGLKA